MNERDQTLDILIGVICIVFLLYIIFKDHIRYFFANKSQTKSQSETISYQLKLIEKLQQDLHDSNSLINQERLSFYKKESDLKQSATQWAITELEKFKEKELNSLRKSIQDTAIGHAANLLAQWKAENTIRIRQEAINKSYAVTLGKISEHLVPFHPNFPFNPKDARFIGSPIDMIVFDGLSDGSEDIDIYFLEIKTGNGKLSERQRLIKKALAKPVIWYEMRADSL